MAGPAFAGEVEGDVVTPGIPPPAMTPRTASAASALLDAYAQVLFLRGARAGAVLVSITLLVPAVATAGLASLLAGALAARAFGRGGAYEGAIAFNPLLAGLALGALLPPGPGTLAIAAGGGVLAWAAAAALDGPARAAGLPLLSVPFVAVTVAVDGGVRVVFDLPRLVPPTVLVSDPALPELLGGMLRALGSVFFLDSAAAGAAVAVLLLVRSPYLAGLAVCGYATGAAARMVMGGEPARVLDDPGAFNVVLTVLALGVLLPRSARAAATTLGAGAATALVLHLVEAPWGRAGVPVLALPFNAVTLAVVGVGRRSGGASRVDHSSTASRT